MRHFLLTGFTTLALAAGAIAANPPTGGTTFTPVRTIGSGTTSATSGTTGTTTAGTTGSLAANSTPVRSISGGSIGNSPNVFGNTGSTGGTAGSTSGMLTPDTMTNIMMLADAIATAGNFQFEEPWEEAFFLMLVAKLYFTLMAQSN